MKPAATPDTTKPATKGNETIVWAVLNGVVLVSSINYPRDRGRPLDDRLRSNLPTALVAGSAE